jgi:protein TonB
MGSQILAEYERTENLPLSDKTKSAQVEDNRTMGLETDNPPFDWQAKRPEARESTAIMSNDLLIQPEIEAQAASSASDGSELDRSFGLPIEEKSILINLYESLRDLFFPPRLPPLELTSTPIPVPDRMAFKRNPWAIAIAATFNSAILVLLIFLGIETIIKPKQDMRVVPIDITTDYQGPKAPSAAGGGGGSPDKSEAIQGRIPPRAAPLDMTPKLEQPPTPTIDVQKDIAIPDNPTMLNFGVSNSVNVKLASGGNGAGLGLGNGNGEGYGNGSGGNIGGGVYHPGGDISAPVPTYDPLPDFSDEARRNKYQGIVLVALIVDVQGNPQNPHVVRTLGMGLDEKALEAVKTYKFKPCMKDHKTPVACYITFEMNFRLF